MHALEEFDASRLHVFVHFTFSTTRVCTSASFGYSNDLPSYSGVSEIVGNNASSFNLQRTSLQPHMRQLSSRRTWTSSPPPLGAIDYVIICGLLGGVHAH